MRSIQTYSVRYHLAIALRQIPILTGDIAQFNMLLFIRMGVWQQIILVPLFLPFKVMMEFTNPYRSFRACIALMQGQSKKKSFLLRVALNYCDIHMKMLNMFHFNNIRKYKYKSSTQVTSGLRLHFRKWTGIVLHIITAFRKALSLFVIFYSKHEGQL